ncbi:MAG: type II toxin-antitoxin system RelE/ParE family toxin [Schwartzia sp.]|nr:type II toxin-antitoxin system RelE/ParE family toxin [Schwartzia sp. (in: firmicutes)]
MKRYDVKLSEGALSRLDALYDYIANKLETPETAQAQTERIEDAILTLGTLPERCRVLFSRHGHELRRLMVDNYSIFYYIKGTDVIVTDILYSKSDIDWRLEDFEGQKDL